MCLRLRLQSLQSCPTTAPALAPESWLGTRSVSIILSFQLSFLLILTSVMGRAVAEETNLNGQGPETKAALTVFVRAGLESDPISEGRLRSLLFGLGVTELRQLLTLVDDRTPGCYPVSRTIQLAVQYINEHGELYGIKTEMKTLFPGLSYGILYNSLVQIRKLIDRHPLDTFRLIQLAVELLDGGRGRAVPTS